MADPRGSWKPNKAFLKNHEAPNKAAGTQSSQPVVWVRDSQVSTETPLLESGGPTRTATATTAKRRLEPKVEAEEEEHFSTTPVRKRQIDSDGDDNGHHPKRARLTQKNLARLNKMGRKRASNEPSNPASLRSEPTHDSTTTRTTSTTTSGFAIQAYKNGVLDLSSSKKPINLQEIYERHARSRATASPPESAYNDYVDRVEAVENEATMVFEVGGKMLKEYPKGYKRVFNQAFTGLPKDAGFNNGLSAPQPDFIEGVQMQEYRPFPVDEHVDGAVLYKDSPGSVTLSHLAGEWKGPGENMERARLQAGYDGAALVYARNNALSYLGRADPPGHAEVTTFATDGTNIKFYAHYAAPSEAHGQLEYHQYQYASANVKDTFQGHKDGRRGLRNGQDYAKQQSYALRDQLMSHWKESITPGTCPNESPRVPLPALNEPQPAQKGPLPAHVPGLGRHNALGEKAIERPVYTTAPTPPPSSAKPRRSSRLSNTRLLSNHAANTVAMDGDGGNKNEEGNDGSDGDDEDNDKDNDGDNNNNGNDDNGGSDNNNDGNNGDDAYAANVF